MKLNPRKFQIGDRVQCWDGTPGTVTRVQTIGNEQSVAPHHRVFVDCDAGHKLTSCEGAEYNFTAI